MRGCKYCYEYKDEELNDFHKKCNYCIHRHCEIVRDCNCICHWLKTN